MMAQRPKERFFELRQVPTARRTAILGIIGAVTFFGIWEIGHYLTPESGQRFLPSVEQVVGKLIFLFADKGFAYDVATALTEGMESDPHVRQLMITSALSSLVLRETLIRKIQRELR